MGFGIQYIDKDRGVSVRALLLDSLSREDMERECRKLVDEGHRDVQLLESRYTVSVVKRFDEIDDDLNKQLKAENAKLREELEQWHRLTAGIELPEYPVTEFHPRNLERENAKLRERVAELEGLIDGRRYVPQEWYALVQSENAKLRELAQRMFDVISSRNSWWDGTCKDTEHFACLMRDLGIEVDE